MRKAFRNLYPVVCALLLSAVFLPPACRASNEVMGKIEFEGKSDVEKTSGVWIDGGYVGYLKELKGSNQVMLLPGKHTVAIRQAGYNDFAREVTIRPGEEKLVRVVMEKSSTARTPRITSTVKIAVSPSRAAVFVDGRFIGHVGEFKGPGRGLLVEPGQHRIRIALPGYESFEADIHSRPEQEVEIKTDLLKSREPLADPLLAPGEGASASSPAAENLPGSMASPTKK